MNLYAFKLFASALAVSAICFADVTVTAPLNDANVGLTTQVVASATPYSSAYRISAMQIYVNSVKVFAGTSSSIDAPVTLIDGVNKIQVKAWDTGSHIFVNTLYVHAGNTSVSDGKVTIKDIDQTTGWGSCDGCAGANASGPAADYWMTQGIASPSLDGNATEFHLGGAIPYANAVWWKKLVSDPARVRAAKHFVYDTYFYYTNQHAAQGLEFNISQYFDGKAFVFGMQCNIRSGAGPHWDVSTVKDLSLPLTTTNMKWQNTGLACPAPPVYSWNHVVMEVERTDDNQVHYLSIALNGVKSYVNIFAPARTASSSWVGINCHYQMNGNYRQESYSSWLDKFSVTYW